MAKTKNRIVVFAIGIILCLLVLEASLRLVGSIYANLSESDSKLDPNADVTILSIGDSVTFGIGAPMGLSYPAQLETLLNSTDGGAKAKYTVINRGRPGQNSAQLLTRFEGQLKQFHPDIVTILIGAQNQANYFGYQEFLEKHHNTKRGFLLSLHDSLDNIRIYKFVRLLLRGGTPPVQTVHSSPAQETGDAQIPTPGEKLAPGLYPDNMEYPDTHNTAGETMQRPGLEQLLANHHPQPGMHPAGLPPEAQNFSQEELAELYPEPEMNHGEMHPVPPSLRHLTQQQLADLPVPPPTEPGMYPNENSGDNTPECVAGIKFKLNGDYDKALASILGVVEKKDVESECYHIAGSIYRERQQYDEAIKWFKMGIKRDPSQYRNYEGIGESYREQGELKEAIKWFKEGFNNARYDSLYELCYVGISVSFEDTGDYQGGVDFFSKEVQREPLVKDYLHTLANDYLFMFKNHGEDGDVHDWITSDIERILALCAQYNAKPILQNYPTEKPIAELYRKIAKRNHVPFVDQNAAFRGFIHGGVLSDEYFVPDGHPNEKGYAIMARNLYQVLQDSF